MWTSVCDNHVSSLIKPALQHESQYMHWLVKLPHCDWNGRQLVPSLLSQCPQWAFKSVKSNVLMYVAQALQNNIIFMQLKQFFRSRSQPIWADVTAWLSWTFKACAPRLNPVKRLVVAVIIEASQGYCSTESDTEVQVINLTTNYADLPYMERNLLGLDIIKLPLFFSWSGQCIST